MNKIPGISESEWQVMKFLWDNNPSTANEIVEALLTKTSWKTRTVRTFIHRLVKKKAIGYKKKGKEYSYYPNVEQAECIRAESKSFLRRVYGGAFKPMLAAFLEDENLSKQDIEELKAILDKKSGA